MSKNIKRWGIRLEGVLKVLQACLASALVAGGLPLAEAAGAREYSLAIQRQPLDDALKAFAEQTGLQIGQAVDQSVDPAVDVAGTSRIVGPVNGRYTAEHALAILLAGQNLIVRRVNERTFAIVPRPGTPRIRDPLALDQSPPRAIPENMAVTPATDDEFQQPAGEVMVTAMFRQESLQKAPLAITALTGADLEARGFVSAARIASVVPNARFAQAQAAFGKAMTAFIRGVGQHDFHPAFEPGVGIYVDDAYHPVLTGSLLDLIDLERVEVLRGPQGTLFGRGSIGGAVRFITRQPQGEDAGYVTMTGGSLDRLEIKSAYDATLVDERLFARVSASARRRRGYQSVLDFACADPARAGSLPNTATQRRAGCEINRYGDEDVTGARIAARFIASDRLEIGATADYSNDDSGPAADTLLHVSMPSEGPFVRWNDTVVLPTYGIRYDSRFITADPRKTYATFADPMTGYAIEKKNSVRLWGLSASAALQLGDDAGARLIVTRRGLDGRLAHDSDGSPLNLQTVDGVSGYSGSTVELRFNGFAIDRKLDWTAGAFTYRSTAALAQTVSIPAFASGFTNNSDHHVDNSNQSLYAHAAYRLTDELGLTGGLRYSRDRRDFHFNDSALGIVRNVPADGNSTDFRLGADYQPTPTLLLYGSVSSGYKPAAFNPRPFQESQLRPVGGEKLIAYELGAKGDYFDGALRANVAAFVSDYRRRIVSRGGTECLKLADGSIIAGTAVADPEHPGERCASIISRTSYVNIPATIGGLELEMQLHPTAALTVTANAGYTHFNANGIQAGNQAAYVPKFNAAVGVAHAFDLPQGGSLTPRADYYYQSSICYALTAAGLNLPTSCVGGYFQLDTRVEYASRSGAWSAALGVTNLTDKQFYYNVFDLTVYGQPTTEGQPSRPREWSVSFTRTIH
jgi:iron complex outermembrane receptor protein